MLRPILDSTDITMLWKEFPTKKSVSKWFTDRWEGNPIGISKKSDAEENKSTEVIKEEHSKISGDFSSIQLVTLGGNPITFLEVQLVG